MIVFKFCTADSMVIPVASKLGLVLSLAIKTCFSVSSAMVNQLLLYFSKVIIITLLSFIFLVEKISENQEIAYIKLYFFILQHVTIKDNTYTYGVKKLTNKIIVITGATGTGKTTVSDYLKTYYRVPQVITHTTRPARKGEVNGKDYYFETDRSFFDNHYLENVVYSGYHYGSSYEGLEIGWQRNPLVSIVLDTKGAVTYEQQLGEQVVVLYLTVSNHTNLVNRLKKRGDDTEMVQKRIASEEYQRDLQLPQELKGKAHVILNDHWENARKQIDGIMQELTNSVANQ